MKPNRILLMAIGAAALALTWYLFRPERLFVDSVVSESLEAAVPTELEAVSAMPIALAQGHFRPVHHAGSGTATVYRFDRGTRVLRLTDFTTDNGPDLYVYLVAAADAPDNETVRQGAFVSLGRLKGNRGDQNYPLPADLDLARYRTVSIWCRRFGVNFAVAPLDAIDPGEAASDGGRLERLAGDGG